MNPLNLRNKLFRYFCDSYFTFYSILEYFMMKAFPVLNFRVNI